MMDQIIHQVGRVGPTTNYENRHNGDMKPENQVFALCNSYKFLDQVELNPISNNHICDMNLIYKVSRALNSGSPSNI